MNKMQRYREMAERAVRLGDFRIYPHPKYRQEFTCDICAELPNRCDCEDNVFCETYYMDLMYGLFIAWQDYCIKNDLQ